MAEQLKRQHDIVTLKVELGTGRRVSFTLQFHEDNQFRSEPLWQGVLEDLGLAAASESQWKPPGDDALHLPAELLTTLEQGWLAHGVTQPCLWVHLVQPYGLLRFLPWERLLASLNVPVLMLPDFIFPPPRESYSLLDIVICGSSPLETETVGICNGLLDAVQAVKAGVDRPVRIHLFTDTDLSAMVSSGRLFQNIVVHRPQTGSLPHADARDAPLQLNDTLRSPWLTWMREALKPYSVDVVHFVCHGYLSGTQGALLFADSPLGRSDSFLSAPIGALELSSFMTQVGAWATVFSAPPDNHDRAGLRALADQIAQMRPGPMMLFDSTQASRTVLEDGYRFVFSRSHQAPPHNQDALYLYCQPYLLSRGDEDHDAANGAMQRNIEMAARNEAQVAYARSVFSSRLGPDGQPRSNGESLSAVSAATERLSEQAELHFQKLLRDDVVAVEVVQQDRSITLDTLDRFRQAVNEIEQARLQSKVDELLIEIETPPIAHDRVTEEIRQGLFEKIKHYVALNDYEKQADLLFDPSDKRVEDLHVRIRDAEASLRGEVARVRHISLERADSYLNRKVHEVLEDIAEPQLRVLGAEDEGKA